MVLDFSPTLLSIKSSQKDSSFSVVFDFSKHPDGSSKVIFKIKNNSKLEVEVWGEIVLKIGKEVFTDKEGFYGSRRPWILQPLTTAHGNKDLSELTNEKGKKVKEILASPAQDHGIFSFRVKYRETTQSLFKHFIREFFGGWKISSKQNFYYNFTNKDMWLHV